MIALIFELIIAIVICNYVYAWKWWVASILFPIIISVSSQVLNNKPMSASNTRTIYDGIIMLIHLGYVISQIVIFHINIGHWYGWIIGAVVGWFLMGFMAPRRWQYETEY